MSATIEQLKKNPILANLKDQALSRLAETAEVLRVGQGMSHIPKTENNDEIYLILEGQAKIEVVLVKPGHPGDSFELKPGDLFGGMRFFDEDLPSQTFVANTELVTVKWPANQWRKIADEDPETGYQLALGLGKQVIQRTKAVSQD